ncbi:hypothetical protein Godav_018832 [Gossypium davidsonii]|uniref:Uncharacterized protein n=2 Tax=Gossypium TaxID=3633 RepID=A0A7J8QZ08_GOSDV|nr:hypothetical protein [Gossypium davidsonii]
MVEAISFPLFFAIENTTLPTFSIFLSISANVDGSDHGFIDLFVHQLNNSLEPISTYSESSIFHSKDINTSNAKTTAPASTESASFATIGPENRALATPSISLKTPTQLRCLKLIVFGIANEDSAGCLGVLRDMEGVARALFSSPIAANDADSAEAGVVLLALEVFISLKWKINDSLFVDLKWCSTGV